MVTDSLGDMLARLNNAFVAEKTEAVLPFSCLKKEFSQVLVKEGFVDEVKVFKEKGRKKLRLVFKSSEERRPFFRRVSKPGKRIYRRAGALGRYGRGKGRSIISTSRGLMTTAEARERKLGGEVLGSASWVAGKGRGYG